MDGMGLVDYILKTVMTTSAPVELKMVYVWNIWVNFPRTGKMVKKWHFLFSSSAVTKRFDFFNFS